MEASSRIWGINRTNEVNIVLPINHTNKLVRHQYIITDELIELASVNTHQVTRIEKLKLKNSMFKTRTDNCAVFTSAFSLINGTAFNDDLFTIYTVIQTGRRSSIGTKHVAVANCATPNSDDDVIDGCCVETYNYTTTYYFTNLRIQAPLLGQHVTALSSARSSVYSSNSRITLSKSKRRKTQYCRVLSCQKLHDGR